MTRRRRRIRRALLVACFGEAPVTNVACDASSGGPAGDTPPGSGSDAADAAVGTPVGLPCVGVRCVPEVVAVASAPPTALAVSASTLVWIEGTEVHACTKDECRAS